MTFRVDNTEGFSVVDLAAMNAAVEEVLGLYPPTDDEAMLAQRRNAVEDAVGNATTGPIEVANLVMLARSALGV